MFCNDIMEGISENKEEDNDIYVELTNCLKKKKNVDESLIDLELLKKIFYYKYINNKNDISFENDDLEEWPLGFSGNINIDYSTSISAIEFENKTSEKKLFLDNWLEHLFSEKNYPIWAKIWAIKGMLTIRECPGSENEFCYTNDNFEEPFVELNTDILVKTIENMIILIEKRIKNNINIDEIISKKDFFDLYTMYMLDLRNSKISQKK